MNQAQKIKLISKSYAVSSIGIHVAIESKISTFAVRHSVSQSEFYNAGQQGFKPEARFDIYQTEYSGEEELEAGGERLTIYRTYEREDGRVELYATKRKGTK